MTKDPYIHATAELGKDVRVGEGSKIWHFVQVRPRVHIGDNCILGRDVYVDEDVRIGNNVKIQNRVSIYKDCILEDGVFVGPHVVFTNDQFPRAINPDGSLKSAEDWAAGSTRVGTGASIGASSVILPSKSIGAFALIGAGSVVTRDVGAHHIIVGNPGRLVGFACFCGHKLKLILESSHECPSCFTQFTVDAENCVVPVTNTEVK